MLILLLSCANSWSEGLPEVEQRAREVYFASPISLRGSLRTASGQPLGGAAVQIQGLSVSTDAQGDFEFTGLSRHNDLLELSAQGFYSEVLALQLQVSLEQTSVALEPIYLQPERGGSARFFFAGDVSFGRRFVDTLEVSSWTELPADDPVALIQASDPEPGARAAFQYIAPFLSSADYRVLNLETPVTDTPETPHPTKDYVFFTLPQAVDAISGQGFEYVSLGNNHVYDYLEPGILDTLYWVERAGLNHSGAGSDASEAFGAYEMHLAGKPYSLLSMTSVDGFQHDVGYVATTERGGAADLTDSEGVAEAIRSSLAAGRYPILQLHTGREYTERPSDYTQSRFDLVVDEGAALVVGHHPHIAQGFDVDQGTLVVHSLGNFIFDQDRLETMLGLLLEVDLEGQLWHAARVTPIYLEDYQPRPLVGELAQRFLRRVGWSSLGYDAHVQAHNGRIHVSHTASNWTHHERTLEVTVEVPEGGVVLLDLRQLLSADESLAYVRAQGAGLSARPGRDLLLFGDFEDVDVDEQDLEVSRWLTHSDARFACVSGSMRGAAGLCMTRDYTNYSDVVVTFRNRIRVEGDSVSDPNKDLSVLGYARGEGRATFELELEFRASEGDLEFGEQTAVSFVPQETWQLFWSDVALPPDAVDPLDRELNARALKLQLRTIPPKRGRALVAVDDLALISWQPGYDLSAGFALSTPHPYDYLRIEGEPGSYAVTLSATSASWVALP